MPEKISVPVTGEQLRLLRAAVPPEAGEVQFPEPDTPEGVVRVDGELVAVRHANDDEGEREYRIYSLRGLFAVAIQGQKLSLAEYDEVRAMDGGSNLIDPTEEDGQPFVIVPESLLKEAAMALDQPPEGSA